MKYKEFKISVETNHSPLDIADIFDILSSILGDCDFESFSIEENILKAYAQESRIDITNIKSIFDNFPIDGIQFKYTSEDMEDINWNEEWEKHYFSPQIFADGKCVVRAPFHPSFPDAEIELLISPKMAFGTGNHQTTSLIIDYLMKADLKNKKVLDMGCGTGILGLLAMKLGAESLVSVDIDKWAYDNVKEHSVLNNVDIKDIIHGDAMSIIGMGPFDLILANITRNVLIADMEKYILEMSNHSSLVMSGFYQDDIKIIVNKGESLGLTLYNTMIKDNWALVEMIKCN